MNIELTGEEAVLLRDMLQQQIKELDKEINRTDSLAFKRGLQMTDRTMERILGRLVAVLRETPENANPPSVQAGYTVDGIVNE